MVRSLEVTGIGWGSVLENPRQDGKILENGINKRICQNWMRLADAMALLQEALLCRHSSQA